MIFLFLCRDTAHLEDTLFHLQHWTTIETQCSFRCVYEYGHYIVSKKKNQFIYRSFLWYLGDFDRRWWTYWSTSWLNYINIYEPLTTKLFFVGDCLPLDLSINRDERVSLIYELFSRTDSSFLRFLVPSKILVSNLLTFRETNLDRTRYLPSWLLPIVESVLKGTLRSKSWSLCFSIFRRV